MWSKMGPKWAQGGPKWTRGPKSPFKWTGCFPKTFVSPRGMCQNTHPQPPRARAGPGPGPICNVYEFGEWQNTNTLKHQGKCSEVGISHQRPNHDKSDATKKEPQIEDLLTRHPFSQHWSKTCPYRTPIPRPNPSKQCAKKLSFRYLPEICGPALAGKRRWKNKRTNK